MSYKDTFKERNKKRYAEKKCVAFLTEEKILHTRYGFDCLDTVESKDFMKIPEVLRNTPDYVVFLRQAIFIEAKGCFNILRLKASDIKSYDWWCKFMPISVFVYNKAIDKHKLVTYKEIRTLALELNDKDYYPDNGKLYYKIPFDKIKGVKLNDTKRNKV